MHRPCKRSVLCLTCSVRTATRFMQQGGVTIRSNASFPRAIRDCTGIPCIIERKLISSHCHGAMNGSQVPRLHHSIEIRSKMEQCHRDSLTSPTALDTRTQSVFVMTAEFFSCLSTSRSVVTFRSCRSIRNRQRRTVRLVDWGFVPLYTLHRIVDTIVQHRTQLASRCSHKRMYPMTIRYADALSLILQTTTCSAY